MPRVLCSRCLQSFEAETGGATDDGPPRAGFAASAAEAGGASLASRAQVCPDCVRHAASVASVRGAPYDRSSVDATAPAAPPTRPDPATPAEPPAGFLPSLRYEVESWCVRREPMGAAVRAPLLAWFALILVRHWLEPVEYQSLFKPLNLGIHELGHYLFAALGQFMAIAGGSLTQCLAPVASMIMFGRQRDWFAIAVCFGWLGTNLFDVATYAGDARSMSLPLVTPGGGEAIHDWNWLLTRMGMLEWDGTVAAVLRLAGSASILACLAAGGWMLWKMARPPAVSRA